LYEIASDSDAWLGCPDHECYMQTWVDSLPSIVPVKTLVKCETIIRAIYQVSPDDFFTLTTNQYDSNTDECVWPDGSMTFIKLWQVYGVSHDDMAMINDMLNEAFEKSPNCNR